MHLSETVVSTSAASMLPMDASSRAADAEEAIAGEIAAEEVSLLPMDAMDTMDTMVLFQHHFEER